MEQAQAHSRHSQHHTESTPSEEQHYAQHSTEGADKAVEAADEALEEEANVAKDIGRIASANEGWGYIYKSIGEQLEEAYHQKAS